MNTLSYFFPSRTGPPLPPPLPTPDVDEAGPTSTSSTSQEEAPPTASTSAVPLDALPESDATQGSVVYLTARSSEGGTRYEITASRQVDPRQVALPDSPLLLPVQPHGDDEDEQKGERRLKEKKAVLLANRTAQEAQEEHRRWLTKLSWSLYLLLRQLLAYVGVPPPTTKLSQLLPKTTPSELENEKPNDVSPTPDLPPPPRRTPSPSTSSTPTLSVPRPPLLTPKTLVLDLDETLIHSTSRPYPTSKAGLKVRAVEVVLEGRSTVYTVYKRPWVDFFLRKVSTWYTVIIFTASLPEYADPVIDWLDGGDGGGGMVGGRLFRSDCRHSNGAYVKDLSVIDADLSRVCLVDNSPSSYAINQANGIPIEGWINDPDDECLLDLLPMLDSLRFTNDVRRVLSLRGFSARA